MTPAATIDVTRPMRVRAERCDAFLFRGIDFRIRSVMIILPRRCSVTRRDDTYVLNAADAGRGSQKFRFFLGSLLRLCSVVQRTL